MISARKSARAGDEPADRRRWKLRRPGPDRGHLGGASLAPAAALDGLPRETLYGCG
eukprot:CAMPEP_0176269358 /NCGR_PEP_ID=MMETSP0121_2-20121125/44150_1 /TAXON_ID=160619 /ORGANISM="Kryptoperidinium foliaceum, Strain CCMP 1326" /LENGTH=55 /DNA_ID=CAMNT_0017609483 /DNA_START=53 /DNA_END=216 /DNA_ORIENTATION=-